MAEIPDGVRSGNFVLVDVRRPQELLDTGKIPGSHNVQLSEVPEAFALSPELFEVQYGFPKPSAEQLVFTCRSGRRATEAWRQTRNLGYCQARVYFGSFLEWSANGQPIENVTEQVETETTTTSVPLQNCTLSEPRGVTMAEIPDGVKSGNFVLVDVRRPQELLDTGKIPGSHNVQLSEVAEAFALSPELFEAQYGFPKPSAEKLVFTCRSGRRATEAWRQTRDLGYCQARVYFGSFLEWSANGQPIENVTEQVETETTTTSVPLQNCTLSEPRGVTMAEIPDGVKSGNFVLVDVRRPQELLDTGKIPGSHNVQLSEVAEAFALSPELFEAQYGFPKPSAEKLVFTCRSGRRATEAWRQTRDLGYCQARVYFGSFLEWSANGQPIDNVTEQVETETTTTSVPLQNCTLSEPRGVTMAEIPDGVKSGNFVLVDVRRPQELLDTGKIPGSHNVQLSEVAEAFALSPELFEAQYGFPKPSAEKLVFTCRSGRRATEAWRQTRDLGYCQARVYFGSFLEWSANGQPIENVTEQVETETTTASVPLQNCTLSEPRGVTMAEIPDGVSSGNFVLVDVRRPQELLDTGKIPGSHNVQLSKVSEAFALSPELFKAQYGFPKPSAEQLVFTCRSGGLATEAWRQTRDLGYCQARVYFGSFSEWSANGQPIENVTEQVETEATTTAAPLQNCTLFEPRGVTMAEIPDGVSSGNFVLVDVRKPQELLDTGKIPGSHNVQLSEVAEAFVLPPELFEAQYGFPKPSAEQLVFSCGSGQRATEAWRQTRDLGYCQARVYFGSFQEWSSNGQPIEGVTTN